MPKTNHKEDLEEQNLFFKCLVENMPGHVFWKNKEGVYLGCNKSLARDLGFGSIDEIIGKTDYDFCDKEAVEIFRKNDVRVMSSKEAIKVEEPGSLRRRDSVYLTQKSPVFDKNGEVVGVFGFSIDISKQKMEVQDKLNELEKIISIMPGHVYWKNKEGVYLGCNENQVRDRGLKSASELLGKTDHELFDKKTATTYRKNDSIVMESKIPINVEESSVSDGKRTDFLTQKTPLFDRNGDVKGIIGISIDITEKKKLEKELKEAEIKERSQEKTIDVLKMFGCSIAHELGAPLGSIIANTVGIEKILPSLIDGYEIAQKHNLEIDYLSPMQIESLRRLVKRIRKAGESANMIVNMFLVNMREAKISKEKFANHSVISCIKLALEYYPFQENQAQLINFDQGTDFNFYGDDTLFVHVIFNLLKNALYYISAASKGEISISLESEKEHNKLIFKDTGKGITEEYLPYIFDRFFTKTENNTGIGLSFCKEVMKSMGGDIICQSVENEYTEFTLFFPKVSAKKRFDIG